MKKIKHRDTIYDSSLSKIQTCTQSTIKCKNNFAWLKEKIEIFGLDKSSMWNAACLQEFCTQFLSF